MDEVASFAKAIGATPMDRQQISYRERRRFARPNYFQIESVRLIIKIRRMTASQRRRPFWGAGVIQIEILERLGPYYLILLTSSEEGWFLSHTEIAELIADLDSVPKNPSWSRGHDDNENQYKINPPLPDMNRFNSPDDLLRKIELR